MNIIKRLLTFIFDLFTIIGTVLLGTIGLVFLMLFYPFIFIVLTILLLLSGIISILLLPINLIKFLFKSKKDA